MDRTQPQHDQVDDSASVLGEQAPATAQPAAAAGAPRRAHSTRRKQPARRGGRPASNPQRQARTYKDMLRAAGTDVEAVCEANAWARQHQVPLDGLAELLEARERTTPAAAYRQMLADADGESSAIIDANDWARERGIPLDAAAEQVEDRIADEIERAERERQAAAQTQATPPGASPAGDVVNPVDPSVFAPPPPEPEAAPAEEPKREQRETYMGEPPDLVEACARGPLFVLGAIAELTRGGLLDLTKPVERTLFAGTPFQRDVRADPVTRMSELSGVAIARRVQAAASSAASAGTNAHPSVAWELVPLGLAMAGAVALPNIALVTGAAKAVGGWLMRGAQGAAGGVGNLFRRGAR
ncbi:hypothetical protein OWM54_41900 [Myxococcus sp. MISCRS1]|uniref:hypothetical protein n=1 Tax=Myxococcus sp. MISCRS1 TaxID=2996786 RepID=UPI00227020B9|nr:hypothetical protein [Myxococcus sp. MISCRS1]MCY1003718.1 hypothetical protein [Myxococcus sp. MISCRS1]